MSDEQQIVQYRTTGYHFKHNRGLIFTALALVTTVFTYGYDAIIIGGTLDVPAFLAEVAHAKALTATQMSIIVAVPNGGAIIGTFLVGYAADRFGRKKILLLGAMISLVGAILQTAASSIALLTTGRFIANVAIFVATATTTAFLNEIAPPELRGILGALVIFSINIGVVLGSGMSLATYAISNQAAYRIPLGLQLLWPLIMFCSLLYVTDSPTSFIIKGHDAAALVSLRKIRRGYSEHELAEEITSLKMQEMIRQEDNEIPWTALFRGTNLRRTLLSGFLTNVTSISGLFYATNYATVFLAQIGTHNPFLLVFGLGILALGGAFAGLFLVYWLDRKTLAISTFSAIAIIDLVIGIMGCLDTKNLRVVQVIAAFSLMFGFFYAAGFGPLLYILPAEIPTARLRNKTTAYTFLTNAATSTVTLFVYPYLSSAPGNLGAKIYLLFAGCMVVVILCVWIFLPELKGRTAAEVDEMFELRLPARKFKGHICSMAPENLEKEHKAEIEQEEVLIRTKQSSAFKD